MAFKIIKFNKKPNISNEKVLSRGQLKYDEQDVHDEDYFVKILYSKYKIHLDDMQRLKMEEM